MSRRSKQQPATVEVIGIAENGEPDPPIPSGRPASRHQVMALLALLAVAAVFLTLTDSTPDTAGEQQDDAATGRATLHSLDRLDALVTAGSLPPELLAAEVYRAAPGPDTLRFLLRSLGGVDGITVATAEGSFDLVSFHPRNPDQLVASLRSGYGPAQNQGVNESWRITTSGAVLTSPLAPAIEHDFAQYNDYGTVSLWSNAGDGEGAAGEPADGEGAGSPFTSPEHDFTPRTVVLGPIPFLNDRRSDPLYPSRTVIVGNTLFALTGDSDYYSNARQFEALIADRGDGQVVLDDGAGWAWVDNPMSNIVVAYPVDEDGATAVWSAETLERIDEHQLAGRRYRRLAVSGNQTTMVGVTFDGTLEVVDLGTDRVTSRFGLLDPDGIADPITLNHDGTIAVTVDHDGPVTLWWVGDPEPVVVIEADAGPPRLVSEYRAPRVSSAVAADAERVAVRNRARPGAATTWSIIDTNPARWVDTACERAGRGLTPGERVELGLDLLPPVCS